MRISIKLIIVIYIIILLVSCGGGFTKEQEKVIIIWSGKSYNYETIQIIEKAYGKGVYTSRTDNKYGWIYFSKPDVTFKVNKNTQEIENILAGKY